MLSLVIVIAIAVVAWLVFTAIRSSSLSNKVKEAATIIAAIIAIICVLIVVGATR